MTGYILSTMKVKKIAISAPKMRNPFMLYSFLSLIIQINVLLKEMQSSLIHYSVFKKNHYGKVLYTGKCSRKFNDNT